MEIRKAAAADAAAITDFNIAMALETERKKLDPDVARAGVEAILHDSSKGVYFGAYEGGRLIASLMITYEWSDWRNGNFWWLQSVYVLPEFRGRGIFKAMFAHVTAEAEKVKNVCGIRLYVEEENIGAQKTYLRLGMERPHYQMFERLFNATSADGRPCNQLEQPD